MRLAGRVDNPCFLVSATSVPSTAAKMGFSSSPLYPDETLAKMSLGRRSAGMRSRSQYSAAILLAMLPMAPSGPSTAPENSEASEVAMVWGRSFHFRCITSPVRLSSMEPSRLLGRLGVLDQQADDQGEREADRPGTSRRGR